MIRLVYNLLWPIGLFFFLPGYLVKMFRRGGYREKFGQRLGFYDRAVRQRLAQQRFTWLHAVSVGEVAIALKLAKELRILQPGREIALTTTTTTGFAFARANAAPWIEVMYMPLDFWPIMHRAFSVIQPAGIVLVEAEVWPNLVAEAKQRRIPIALVNARLSPRSEKRFLQFRRFVGPIFRQLDLICVSEREDVGRWQALGVASDRLQRVGSIKFDPAHKGIDRTTPGKVLHDLKIDGQRPTIFGGSTHLGEEPILGEIFSRLRAKFDGLLLILAPRHAERAREVQRALQKLGLRVALRSQPSAAPDAVDCLILDSTGELANWYPVATVVFMGKSLTAHGGQNPVEPVVAGVPVIFGPNMENFAKLARELLEKKGAIEVADAGGLERAIGSLLADPGARRTLVENAEEVISQHRGATERTASLIAKLL